MWLLAIPLAALAGYIWYDKTHGKNAPLAAPPKGTSTVDGHGTGVLTGPVPTTVDGHGTGVLPEPDPLLAAAAAAKVQQENAAKVAAAQAAAQIAQQQSPAGGVAAAALAAETVRLQIINALNTPEGDRTPEQLALLSGVASLPTLGG